MECKDCKNYEPEKNKKLEIFTWKLFEACDIMDCSECPIGPGTRDCKVAKLWNKYYSD